MTVPPPPPAALQIRMLREEGLRTADVAALLPLGTLASCSFPNVFYGNVL